MEESLTKTEITQNRWYFRPILADIEGVKASKRPTNGFSLFSFCDVASRNGLSCARVREEISLQSFSFLVNVNINSSQRICRISSKRKPLGIVSFGAVVGSVWGVRLFYIRTFVKWAYLAPFVEFTFLTSYWGVESMCFLIVSAFLFHILES